LGSGVVHQDDLLVALIQVGQAAETGPDFNEPLPPWWQEFLKGDALDAVFVGSVLAFPEIGTIATAFVITDAGQGQLPEKREIRNYKKEKYVSRETIWTC
jgi:hypothetical protein